MMLERMGIGGGGPAPDPAAARERMLAARLFDDIDPDLEMMIRRMIGILLIEISAFHVFAWAEELLSDPDLVAGDGDAARLVSYIRQDEAPHVAYLATTLTEMRDRTFIGESGRRIPGTEVVGRLWDRGLEESLGAGRQQNRRLRVREVEDALEHHPRRGEILDEFHAGRREASEGAHVKFGVFYEHQLPRPGRRTASTASSRMRSSRSSSRTRSASTTSGRSSTTSSRSTRTAAPEVFLAAVSQRTKNIRLGHGIVQTPAPFNHPARIAERVSMLDLVSNGRADFGTGESSSEAELGGFLVDPLEKREMWEEGCASRCGA